MLCGLQTCRMTWSETDKYLDRITVRSVQQPRNVLIVPTITVPRPEIWPWVLRRVRVWVRTPRHHVGLRLRSLRMRQRVILWWVGWRRIVIVRHWISWWHMMRWRMVWWRVPGKQRQ